MGFHVRDLTVSVHGPATAVPSDCTVTCIVTCIACSDCSISYLDLAVAGDTGAELAELRARLDLALASG